MPQLRLDPLSRFWVIIATEKDLLISAPCPIRKTKPLPVPFVRKMKRKPLRR